MERNGNNYTEEFKKQLVALRNNGKWVASHPTRVTAT
ncbi:MAG: transposase-like protein [Clostridium sp.]|jgi:transposase-like protein